MRKNLLRILLVLSMIVPSPATAMGSVQVEDTIAGIDTQATVAGLGARESYELHLQSPAGEDIALPFQSTDSGEGRLTLPAKLILTAGTYHAFVRNGINQVAGPATFDVLPGRVDPARSSVTTDTVTLAADGLSEAIVTVSLADTFGNPLPGRPVEVLSSRSQDRIIPLNRDTDAYGQQHIAIRTTLGGDIVVRALDLLSGTPLQQTVHINAQGGQPVGGFTSDLSRYAPDSPAPAVAAPSPFRAQLIETAAAQTQIEDDGNDFVDDFVVSIEPKEPGVDDWVTLDVQAYYQQQLNTAFVGSPVTVYSPTDAGAELPLRELIQLPDGTRENRGKITFHGGSPGRAFVPQSVLFKETGTQVLRVEFRRSDGVLVTKDINVNVVGKNEIPNSRKIEVLAPRGGQKVEGEVTVQGIGPRYTTLSVYEISGGEEVELGSVALEEDQNFSVKVQLPDQEKYTLKVRDSTQRYESIAIDLERNPRNLPLTISFSPEVPQQGEGIVATVRSVPDLQEILLQFETELLTLTESAVSGTYSVFFQAPDAGDRPYTLSARSGDGTTSELNGTLQVQQPALTKVQNLRFEPGKGSIELRWDPVPGSHVTSYGVYVGTEPTSFGVARDTGEPTPGVTIEDLQSGIPYYVVVTAKSGELEGPPSDVLAAHTLGWTLEVKPRQRSLLLEYEAPSDMVVKEFTLEFWLTAGHATTVPVPGGEFRGSARKKSFVLPDLLDNGVTYSLRLTPIVINQDGTLREDPPMTGGGTPLAGNGFDLANGFDPSRIPPSDTLHSGAPATSDSGIPLPGWIALGVSIAGIALYLNHRRRLKQTHAFLRAMHRQYTGTRHDSHIQRDIRR